MEGQRTFGSRAKGFITECWRVLRVTKKPTMKEYKAAVTISGIGILLIGFIGFVVTIFKQLFFS
jgi:protein transport protein SEC61 subunit gamma and related proteins